MDNNEIREHLLFINHQLVEIYDHLASLNSHTGAELQYFEALEEVYIRIGKLDIGEGIPIK